MVILMAVKHIQSSYSLIYSIPFIIPRTLKLLKFDTVGTTIMDTGKLDFKIIT